MCVDEGRRIRPHDNRGKDRAAIYIERVAFEPEREGESIQYFERIDPCFSFTILVPDDRGAPADDIEEPACMGGARQLQSAGSNLEFWNTVCRRWDILSVHNDHAGDQQRRGSEQSHHSTSIWRTGA